MESKNQEKNSEVRPAPMAVRHREGLQDGLIGSDIDVQVATAKRYPRSIGQAKERAIELATLDQETAESCIYAIPRAGKIIEGLSVRGAEILANSFGNFRVSAKTTGEDESFVYAQAIAWDLETNVAISYETKRRITNRDGRKYGDDMIMVTSNAAVSIALRNVVFRIIPRSIFNEVYEAVRKTAAGNARTLKQRRTEMLQYFRDQGIAEKQILELLSIVKIDDITGDNLTTLRGIATSIKEGVTSVEAIFCRSEKDVEQPKTEKAQAEPTKSESPKTTEKPATDSLDEQKSKMIDKICTQLGKLHPGDSIEVQAARLKTLNYVFGKTVLDEVVKLPVEILEAGLGAMKSQARAAEDIPV